MMATTRLQTWGSSLNKRHIFAPLVILVSGLTHAQPLIKVSERAWLELNSHERTSIQTKYIVELATPSSFGFILDNQGINESTPGTNTGAGLGGAIADAAYIDNAFKNGNYSAKNHLAAGLLGVVLGSALDSKGKAQFHFRYAVRLGSGGVGYFDEVKSDPFRHPVGVCVSVPSLSLIDQQLCTQNGAALRAAYLGAPATSESNTMIKTQAGQQSAAAFGAANVPGSTSTQINCKLGDLAPVKTSAEKCQLINGRKVDD